MPPTVSKSRSASKPRGKPVPPDPMIAASQEASQLLKAMASPVRLRILCLLAEREMAVGDIAARLDIREQATSQQLAQLRLEGLVQPRRDAQRIYYSLASAEIRSILEALRAIYCPH